VVLVAAAVAVILVIVAAVVTVVLIRSDGGDSGAGPAASPTLSVSPQPSATASPSTPPATPGFGFQPLWPFAGAAEAAAWQRSYRSGGHQPWHLDPAMTALSFTREYLGYRDVDQVVSTRTAGDEAWIGVGYSPSPGRKSTAAVLHLARIGSGDDAPWEVVGSRDTTLSLTKPAYGTKVVSPVTVGGRVTGVDESLVVQLRTQGRPVLARSAGLPAGGEDTPWSTSLAFAAPPGAVLTIAVATGGHVQEVERFAITGATAGTTT
jgi:hypothetical protein